MAFHASYMLIVSFRAVIMCVLADSDGAVIGMRGFKF